MTFFEKIWSIDEFVKVPPRPAMMARSGITELDCDDSPDSLSNTPEFHFFFDDKSPIYFEKNKNFDTFLIDLARKS